MFPFTVIWLDRSNDDVCFECRRDASAQDAAEESAKYNKGFAFIAVIAGHVHREHIKLPL